MTDQPYDYGEPWERFGYIGQSGGLRRLRTKAGVEGPLVECKEPPKRTIAEFVNDSEAKRAMDCVNALATVPDPAAFVRYELRPLLADVARGQCDCDFEHMCLSHRARALLASLPKETEQR